MSHSNSVSLQDGNQDLSLGLLQRKCMPTKHFERVYGISCAASNAASNSLLSVETDTAQAVSVSSAHSASSGADAGHEISPTPNQGSSSSRRASASVEQEGHTTASGTPHAESATIAVAADAGLPPTPGHISARVIPLLQTGFGQNPHPPSSSPYSTDRPAGPRELTGTTSFSLEMFTPSLNHTASFGGLSRSGAATPALAGSSFSSPTHGSPSIPASGRSHATAFTDIDDSVASPYQPIASDEAFPPTAKSDSHPPVTGFDKGADWHSRVELEEGITAVAPQAYPTPSTSASPEVDVEAGTRAVHVVHLEDSDDDEEIAGGAARQQREPLKFCDYAGCLSLGLLASIGAGILWSRTVKGGSVEDEDLLRWSIAATIVAVLTGYCVWLCVMTSKFEALQAEWEEEAAGQNGGSGRANSVFNCKEDCRNPAVGTCKLLVLVVGGIIMLPIFILPYLLGKGALRGCRCCCQHCCVPCLEGCFSCVGRIIDGCLVPCCQSISRGLLCVWNTLCVPVYTHLLRPMFLGAWNTMVWIFNNVVHPVFNFLYESVRCLVNSVITACTWIYESILVPIARGVAAAGRCVMDYVLRPVWNGLCAAVSCIYNSVLRPAARCVHGYLIMPVWRAILCFYNTILVNMWRYLIVWPLQRLSDCLQWIFGTCFPAIGRALYCVFDTLVAQPVRWIWLNAISPLLHYMFVVPWRYAIMPVLRAMGNALAAIGRAIGVGMAAVGRFFASVGRALAGRRR